MSLSDSKSICELSEYRFDNGDFKGHTVGNIVLLALIKIYGSFNKAILELSKMLNIKGKVLPVSLDEVTLMGEFIDGNIRLGETNIVNYDSKIKRLYALGNINKDVIKEINESDMIIYSPGSLYTSLLSNLVFNEIKEALDNSRALKVYVSNIMTQKGETDDYNLLDHIKVLKEYIGNNIDIVIANNNFNISDNILNKYLVEGSKLVDISNLDINTIYDNLIEIDDDKLRHNNKRVSAIIMKLLLDL